MSEVIRSDYQNRKFQLCIPEVSVSWKMVDITIGSIIDFVPDWGKDLMGWHLDWMFLHIAIYRFIEDE